ncbi:MAG TPA: fused MFS/spermidine synthase, partial [Coriobacteriia bacterium]|nr:fused MFS/spermidine synthase [Coriobacteriia bacterium]
RIGRSAGSLYAVSTAGSIIGTLATSFWLIPVFQVGPLIVGAGMLLAASAVLTFALPAHDRPARHELTGRSWARGVAVVAVAAVLTGAFVLGGVVRPSAVAYDGSAILFERDTEYHRVLVTESDGVRTLLFDRSRQTSVSVEDPTVSRLRYTDYLHLALAVNPEARRVLVLGLGGGALPARMLRDYPAMTIDAVEIDPVVVDVARRFFSLPEDDRLSVHVMDARRWVQGTEERYDVIVVDCYYADAIPFHLMTQEFFEELDGVLEPGGVVAYNLISAVEGDRSELFRSLYRTAGTVWDHAWVFPVERRDGRESLRLTRNIVMLASDSRVSRQTLLERVESRVDGQVTVEGFERFGERLYTGVVGQADVPVLTDSYAPTDSLIRVD